MKMTLGRRLTSLILALPLVLPLGAAPVVAQENCWDNSAIQSALASGEIEPVSAVLAREGVPNSTEVLSVKICEQGGRLVYVLAVLEASGQARNLTLDAQ